MIPWTRLELDTRDDTLREGLRAEVHDALWLLARQWQMGEFRGEDGGTPVLVRCRTTSDAPQVLLAGGEAITLAPGGDALESRIEREGPHTPDLYTRALGGALFGEMLAARELGAVARRCARRFKFAIEDTGDAALLAAAAVGPDAEPLHAALHAGVAAVARALLVTRRQEAAFADAAAQWLQWYGARRGDGGGLAWSDADGTYHAAVRTRAGAELAASAHEGGPLEWWALDARHGGDDTAPPPPATDAEFVPLPLEVPGTGTLRFWEMEDAQVDLSALAAGSTEVARMLLSEFALLWGHDWFSVPLPVASGALVAVRRVVVVDTFGVETEMVPARAGGGFGLWRHAGLDTAAAGLWVPDGATLDAPAPIERLDILLDEGSNMLWAYETPLCSALALPLEGPPPAAPAAPASAPARPATWRYRPFTPPPAGWVPLAVVDGTLRVAALVLGDIPMAPLRTPMARGLALRADALRTEGLSLVRQWEVARRRDGQLVAWIARRLQKQPPTSTATLVFDRLET